MTRFTMDEQITMMTLWSIFRSPLMFGGELRDNDNWTLSLFTNKEVIDLQQNSHDNRLIYREDDKVVWTAKEQKNYIFVALFNLGESEHSGGVLWNQLGLQSEKRAKHTWKQKENGTFNHEIIQILPPHGAILLKLH